MAAPDTKQARQAALLVHGLSEPMQRRVMNKLAAADALRLQGLLKELVRLGISPSISQHLQQMVSVAGASNAESLTALERVRSLSAADVARCLQPCAAITVAQLLRAEEWPWKQHALDRMSELRRAEVLRCLRSEFAPLAPAVLSALCERLCQELAHLRANASNVGGSLAEPSRTGAGPRTVSQWLRRLIRWTR